MSRNNTLAELSPGISAQVTGFKEGFVWQQKLLDMGLTPNTSVKCLFRSVTGDPTAYRICGTVLALRRDTSRNILIEQRGIRQNE